jgi:acetyltransferase
MGAIESKKNGLEGVFNPRSVAVIGASNQRGKWGYMLLERIIGGGFKGEIYPVNPKGGEIQGLKAYPNVKDIEGPVDLAVIGIPASVVQGAVEDCVAKGVKGLIIITAGYGETGTEGKKLEDEIAKTVQASGTRLVGPNCIGIINTAASLNASSLPFSKGDIGFVCQSGGLCEDVRLLLQQRKWGFSKLISMGNQTDIRFHEYLDYLKDDEDTKVVLLHIEEVKEGKRFLKAAKEVVKKKPIVALKVGQTTAGERAVMSHTGSLAGRYEVYQAAFKQVGIITASDVNDLVDFGGTLAQLPPLRGRRVVILTDGGGHAALACDAAEKSGLEVPILSSETQSKLREVLLPQSGTVNPVDFAGAAEYDLWSYTRVADIVLQDNDIDGFLITCAIFGIYSEAFGEQLKNLEVEVTQKLCEIAAKYKKPVIMHSLPVPENDAIQTLKSGGIPVYTKVETAVRCMAVLAEYGSYLETMKAKEAELPSLVSKKPKAGQIIEKAKTAKRYSLLETEAKEILKEYGIPVTKFGLAKNKQEAVKFAEEVGYPAAAKIVSPQIVHKSDANGVKLNLKDVSEIEKAFDEIIKNARAYNKYAQIEGVLISPMETKGLEVIVGMMRDRQFGPVIMFGLGGIFVEVLKDVSFRITPVSRSDAYEMVRQIKGYPILGGIRGEEPSDIEAIVDIIMKVSSLVSANEKISELDLNPVFVFKKGASVVDARIILGKE